MKVEIRKNNLGYNGYCSVCNKIHIKREPHPYIVYHKKENETRGHNTPVCSMECAEKLLKILEN